MATLTLVAPCRSKVAEAARLADVTSLSRAVRQLWVREGQGHPVRLALVRAERELAAARLASVTSIDSRRP